MPVPIFNHDIAIYYPKFPFDYCLGFIKWKFPETLTLPEHFVYALNCSGVRVTHLLLLLCMCYFMFFVVCACFLCLVVVPGLHSFVFHCVNLSY